MEARRGFGATMGDLRTGALAHGRPRILLARDPRLSTCDALVRGIERLIDGVEIADAASIEGAREWVLAGSFDLCLVCLDLPPAPRGGARLARELVARRHEVVLITRSLRWLPPGDELLRSLPWMQPDGDPATILPFVQPAPSHVRPSFESVPDFG